MRGRFAPSRKGGSEDLPREKFLISDACMCILMHFGSFWGPRISVIQSFIHDLPTDMFLDLE